MRSLIFVFLAGLTIAGPVAAQSPDPVGDYTWSFTMASGEAVNGTMNIGRSDSGYVATFTSDHTQGSLATRSVNVDGRHVVIDLKGDFGEFTVDMQLSDTVAATFKLVTDDGPTGGPMAIQRVKRSARIRTAVQGIRTASSVLEPPPNWNPTVLPSRTSNATRMPAPATNTPSP